MLLPRPPRTLATTRPTTLPPTPPSFAVRQLAVCTTLCAASWCAASLVSIYDGRGSVACWVWTRLRGVPSCPTWRSQPSLHTPPTVPHVPQTPSRLQRTSCVLWTCVCGCSCVVVVVAVAVAVAVWLRLLWLTCVVGLCLWLCLCACVPVCLCGSARVSLLLDAAKHQLLARQPSCFTTKEAHELVTCFQDLSTAHNGGDAYLSAATPQQVCSAALPCGLSFPPPCPAWSEWSHGGFSSHQLDDLAALLAETLASSVLDAASVVPAAVPAWKTRTNAASPTPEAEYGLELAADSEAAAAPAPSLFTPGPRPGRRVGNTPDVSMDDDDI